MRRCITKKIKGANCFSIYFKVGKHVVAQFKNDHSVPDSLGNVKVYQTELKLNTEISHMGASLRKKANVALCVYIPINDQRENDQTQPFLLDFQATKTNEQSYLSAVYK